VIRTEDVHYGQRRLAKPFGSILSELERLARTSLPADPTSNSREHFALFAAQLLHRLLDIHPFLDLNGRMSRMVVRGMVASSGRYQLRLVVSHRDGDAHEAYVRALRTVDHFSDDVREDDRRTPAGAYAGLAEHLLPDIIDEEDVSEEPP
jgi:fido (protein-threonine AMPylation protein)